MPKSVLDQIGKEHTEEIERLRQQVAKLVDALHRISLGSQNSMTSKECLGKEARAAIAKATGGE